MQDSFIRQIHERGYIRPKKTEKLLKIDYWFKGARQIDGIIQNCINCILAERKTEKEEDWLYPKRKRSFDTYHIDYLGLLPSRKK